MKKSLLRMVPQPKNIGTKLFPHQLASIYRMEKLEREKTVERDKPVHELRSTTIRTQTRLGINSDQTGYGKTMSMIGLIVRDKMEWDMNLPHTWEDIKTESAGLVRTRTINRYDRLSATLILVSPTIINQWKQEFTNTILTVGIVSRKKDIDNIDVTECDVVIVTTTMYNYLVRSHAHYAWKRFIFDEPGHTRVSGMKEVMAGFYWFVTATPNAITSRHRNCRGSFMKHIIENNWGNFDVQFGDLIIKNNEEFVKSSFVIPETVHYYHNCFQPLLNTIVGLVNPAVMTMIDAGNIEGAITALGGHKTKNIVELVRKKKLEELEEAHHKIRVYTIRDDQEQIEVWTKKQSHIKIQLSELATRFQRMLSEPCLICCDTLKDPVMDPTCQNMFCGECLLTWLKSKKTCPMCRASITLNDLVYISHDTENVKLVKNNIPKTKIGKVLELIENNKSGKFLIFSIYNETFDPICRALEEHSITYTMMKGNSTTRQKNINSFKSGDTQVIFLNSNFNGAGINLQETTDLIIYHKMKPNIRTQIIGRAERIGRADSLRVHHLQVHS